MNKAIILVGLPGCGKTTQGNKILESNPDALFLDDLKDTKHITNAFQSHDLVLISDPWLCVGENLDCCKNFLFKNNIKYNILFWDNDLEKCLKNVKERNDGRKISENFIKALSDNYCPPHIDFFVKGIDN